MSPAANVRARISGNRLYRRARKRLRAYSSRDRFFRRAGAVTPYLGVQSGDIVYFVATADRNIGRSLFVERGRRKEHHLLETALQLLDGRSGRPGRRLVLDIGANIGTTIVPALAEHGFERGLAFEPEPRNYRLLRANLAVNGLDDRSRAFRLALSDQSGEAILDVTSRNSGRYWVTAAPRPGRRTVTVPVRRLGELLATETVAPADVDLLWMDVEGHEPHVLAGAPSLLEQGVPIVLEFSPPHLRRASGLELLLAQLRRFYTSVYDLHRPQADPVPVSGLDALVDRYTTSFTDLLVVHEAPS